MSTDSQPPPTPPLPYPRPQPGTTLVGIPGWVLFWLASSARAGGGLHVSCVALCWWRMPRPLPAPGARKDSGRAPADTRTRGGRGAVPRTCKPAKCLLGKAKQNGKGFPCADLCKGFGWWSGYAFVVGPDPGHSLALPRGDGSLGSSARPTPHPHQESSPLGKT